jgi:cytochrome oxidase Cu insertion factor (SCO1/SenC/PrrC family)
MTMRRRMHLKLAACLMGLLLLLSSGPVTALAVGDKAPDFSLPATSAEKVNLADYLGKKNVVVFFYVYAFTNP